MKIAITLILVLIVILLAGCQQWRLESERSGTVYVFDNNGVHAMGNIESDVPKKLSVSPHAYEACVYTGALSAWVRPLDKQIYFADASFTEITKRQQMILGRRIQQGMSKRDVFYSWGEPRDKTRSVHSFGVNETWIYGGPVDPWYLFFEDDRLTGWHEGL